MADVINPGTVSYCGIQATEVTMFPALRSPEWERYFDIRLGIRYKQQLVLDARLKGIIQEDTGCGRTPTGQVINLSEKFIEVCKAKVNLDQCATGLDQIFMEEWAKTGNDKFDITGTKIETYIEERVADAMENDLWDIVWFGDSALSNQVIGFCDGLWKRLIAAVGVYGIYRYNIADGALAECAAVTAFRDLEENANLALKRIPKAERYFAVTEAVYQNYLTCMEEKCCGERGVRMLTDGTEVLTFRGIEVRVEYEWDEAILNYGLSNPNRIVYTWNKNLIVGTDSLADTNLFKIIYNPYEEVNYVNAHFNIATQYKFDQLTAIAY